MLLTPRPYQIDATYSIPAYFSEKAGNPVIAMPTGTGKSVVIAMFLQMVFQYWPNQRVMVLTHVKELIQQNYEKLLTLWPSAPAGVFSAGLNRKDVGRRITFAGIASVAKQAKLFGHQDLILIDEAHLVSPNDETLYRKFLKELKEYNPNLKVVGFTATPWRLGTGKITEDGIFTDICFDNTGMEAFNQLIADGYLTPVIPKKTRKMLDTEGIHMRGGEFIPAELQLAVDKYEVTVAALREALEVAHDRAHWLIFASGVEHAEHITEILNDMGVAAVAIHSNLTKEQRDSGIEGFKTGRYRVAVNNNVLTTGFDFPGIDCIVVLRPTASTVLWVQMLGRGTRPVYAQGFDLSTVEGRMGAIAAGPKQNCLVLDFAGNTRRLGPINDPVIPRKKGSKGGEAPVKLCGNCATYNHASATHCCHCGQEFSFQVKIKATAGEDDLLRGDAPIVETFKVDHITYSKHQKVGRPDAMKVSYYCGLKVFTDYVCIEHEGFAGRKARIWWRDRIRDRCSFPETTQLALEKAGHLEPATHLRVWINKQYPEILAYCYDGTCFGKEEAAPPPTVTTPQASTGDMPFEDDIPF